MAAFAVPRFISLQVEARKASVNSLAGALRSATAVTHSMWLITGGTNVAMEGVAAPGVAMSLGYPTLASIDDTLVNLSGFTYDDTTGVFTKDGAATGATCSVGYAAPLVAGNAPIITIDISNCS